LRSLPKQRKGDINKHTNTHTHTHTHSLLIIRNVKEFKEIHANLCGTGKRSSLNLDRGLIEGVED